MADWLRIHSHSPFPSSKLLIGEFKMENVFEFLTDLSVLSSTGLIGSAFSFLGDSADWAGAVADLIGLLG
ncbi:hypothetical protein CGBL_0126530 [Corynebacterium glutamicum]|nr:hypothetical protein CGBL_0126530 [Corynebacterium glutamicum]